jgi:hypothetical protein
MKPIPLRCSHAPAGRSWLKPKRDKGAALIIVLAFVVLLTGLAVAYLSRSTTDRQLAQSSFHDTSADLLARSALDIVIGDFRQEVVSGSTVTSVPGIYYMPSSNANVVPVRNGTSDAIPNLIRRSVSTDGSISSPAVSSRASAMSSATVSANGRLISLAQWNEHYLIPRQNPTAPDSVTEPISDFVAPDWVLVTRDGPVSQSWQDSLKDATPTNTNYAVGRYAYAVYDEGGLLDMNVAGYPAVNAPSAIDVGRKGVLAFADLTALSMTNAAINKFILFRNPATTNNTSLLGTTGTFSPTATSSFVSYYTVPTPAPAASPFQLGTSQDFGSVRPLRTGTGPNSRTDQNFVTRRELINFWSSTGIISVNTLQYLGTFSREQNGSTFVTQTSKLALMKRLVPRFYMGDLAYVKPNPANNDNSVKKLGLRWRAATTGPPPVPAHWRYVGPSANPNDPNSPALTHIPAIRGRPGDLFQRINYALHPDWDIDTDDTTHTIFDPLKVGAAIIDQYDPNTAEYTDTGSLTTGTFTTTIEHQGGFVYGMENPDNVSSTGVSLRPAAAPTPPPTGYAMLNRPFRNVGELGYTYNYVTGATLNFKDPYDVNANRDAGLLDFFTYNSANPRSGIISLNTRQVPVLAAIIKAALPSETGGTAVTAAQATTAATSIVNATTTTPALSRVDVARMASVGGSAIGSTEEQQETVARVLAELGQTRTWGLLIDLVAQTGHYAPNATDLPQFIVEGEKRYWLHVAIDRFDGTVIGQQLEQVGE